MTWLEKAKNSLKYREPNYKNLDSGTKAVLHNIAQQRIANDIAETRDKLDDLLNRVQG